VEHPLLLCELILLLIVIPPVFIPLQPLLLPLFIEIIHFQALLFAAGAVIGVVVLVEPLFVWVRGDYTVHEQGRPALGLED
jgi:hypothetical protein